jgi:hypothetical protein
VNAGDQPFGAGIQFPPTDGVTDMNKIIIQMDLSDEANGITVQVWSLKSESDDLPDLLNDREFASYDAAARFADRMSKQYGVEWESN